VAVKAYHESFLLGRLMFANTHRRGFLDGGWLGAQGAASKLALPKALMLSSGATSVFFEAYQYLAIPFRWAAAGGCWRGGCNGHWKFCPRYPPGEHRLPWIVHRGSV
jgi:hypothetical protein